MSSLTPNTITKLISIQKKLQRPFEITVAGFSMSPLLKHGDIITVQNMNNYKVGDILVFNYGINDYRVHRLIEIINDNYNCKGDNAFLKETILFNQIIGKVIKAKRDNIEFNIEFSKDKLSRIVNMSKEINKKFERYNNCIQAVKCTRLYKDYIEFFYEKID